MSDDYIKRDDTLKAMDTWDKFGCDGHGRLVPYTKEYVPYVKFDDMMKAVEGQPPADVVEVVRCKDCKHSRFSEDVYPRFRDKKRRCACYKAVRIVADDDYCSWGERKDDD